MRKPWLISAIFLFAALPASASVRVNEVAWMGTAVSANDEWIELAYLDGTSGAESISLEGWHLSGKDGSPNIALKGSVAPGGYYLIERTSDATLPGLDADLVASFGKGLSNSGETLTLTDASGTPIDTVVGGNDWSKVGGDNKTKQTAQRTLNGWTTGAPTPRAQNIIPVPKKVATIVSVPKTALLASTQAAAVAPKEKTPEKIFIATPVSHIATGTEVAANILWEKQDSGVNGTMLLWMGVAIALFIIATVIIMHSEVEKPTDADQYAIIEDIIEGDEEDARIYLDKQIWDE